MILNIKFRNYLCYDLFNFKELRTDLKDEHLLHVLLEKNSTDIIQTTQGPLLLPNRNKVSGASGTAR